MALANEVTAEVVEEPVSNEVTIRVTDHRGERVPGAHVQVDRANDTRNFRSDETGVLRLTEELVRGSLVSAWTEVHATDIVHVHEEPLSSYDLKLLPAWSISGRVSMSDGAPVPDGARVFAFRSRGVVADDRDILRMARLPRGFSAPIAPDGTYRVEGLKLGSTYSITAYGGGVMKRRDEALRWINPPATSVDFEATYLAGVKFELEEPPGGLAPFLAALRFDLPDDRGPRGYGFKVEIDRDQPVSSTDWSVQLAGLAPPGRRLPESPWSHVFTTGSTPEEAEVQGEVVVEMPRCGSQTAAFRTVLATSPDALPTVVIPAPDVPASWRLDRMGSLEIALRAPWLQTGPASQVLNARVKFLPKSEPHGVALVLAADWVRAAADGAGAFVVPEIPEGSYEVWLYESSVGASIPYRLADGWQVEISAGERAQIDATDVPLAGLEIEAFGADGRPFTGAIAAELLVRDDRGGATALSKMSPVFRSAPYLFPLIQLSRLGEDRTVMPYYHTVNLPMSMMLKRPSVALEAGTLARIRMDAAPYAMIGSDGRVLPR